ncbi:hypothetical protein [Bradyrhizobium algeriense]|uniref:hypothetical protein n=1 Tax=Bradyrhizobium algeriense TaxID=634784 RepID=UPI0011AE4C38|nr:hypothetical protein [Bradyrhizobium algeriense]
MTESGCRHHPEMPGQPGDVFQLKDELRRIAADGDTVIEAARGGETGKLEKLVSDLSLIGAQPISHRE